jgi:glycerophosphoryl diester phosphodiesterase
VVMHDGNTKRTAGVDKLVSEQTWEELRGLDAGAWKGESWRGERIPLLEEVLAALPPGKPVYIEIKCGAEVLPELERVLKASGRRARDLVIIAFGYEVAKRAKQRFPHIAVLLLASFKKVAGAWSPSVVSLIERAKTAKLDGLDLSHNGPLNAVVVRQIMDAGLKLCVWTVNDAAAARHMVEAGVEGITTDRPQWLREQLAAPKGE